MRPEAATLAILLILTAAARADPLTQAQRKLDAANQAAQRHHAASLQAARAQHLAQHRQAALITQEIAANAALRVTEDRTVAITTQLTALTAQTTKARAELDHDAAAIAPLLPLIARLALHPAATLLATSNNAGRAAEGALIMQGLTREIATRAAALHTAEHHYTALTTRLAASRTALTQSIVAQQQNDQALQLTIAAARQTNADATARHTIEAAAAAHAAATAHDLAGMIATLHRQRRIAARQARAQARTRAAAARIPTPSLPHALRNAPVAGTLIHGFGATTAAGPATGDTFATAPGAIVSAACTGHIVFARPFQSYGKLLILDCGSGYDFVMAGLDRFTTTVGQTVRAGQPVGAMTAANPKERPRLYVELRHDGNAIDPAGHFGASP